MSQRKLQDAIADAAEIADFYTVGMSVRVIEEHTGWRYNRSRNAVQALLKTLPARQTDVEILSKFYVKGMPTSAIQDRAGWTYYRARNALKSLLKTLPPEAAAEPEISEKSKKKAPRISHITTVDANLERGVVHRFLVSAAQDDTPVHEDLWINMHAYASFCGASIFIGGHTYQLGLFEDHCAEANVYDTRLSEYMCHDRVQLTPDLLFVGNANILPTTANPLNGWTTANNGNHVIVPHSRIALQSIPRLQGQPPRFAVSTGTVTMPNYTARAAGQKSLFHHTFGFLMVEIDADGEVFMRPVSASADGTFQDLDVFVGGGVCYPGRRVKAITWGDIHFEQMNPVAAWANWGVNLAKKLLKKLLGQSASLPSMLDTLQPEYQFVHDTLDFRRRNHHNLHDPHLMAAVQLKDANVESEVQAASDFVNSIRRDWCKTVMVESNHDAALGRWLKNDEGARDPENAYFWHELNSEWHRAIRRNQKNFNVVEFAMRQVGLEHDVKFVGAGGSYLVDDVECGLHGDLGIGGSNGSPNQFRRFGAKTTSGHTHTPLIVDGAYVAGVSADLDQGYNKGPTTWAHANVIQYDNGKRTIVCLAADGRWRATGDLVEHQALAA